MVTEAATGEAPAVSDSAASARANRVPRAVGKLAGFLLTIVPVDHLLRLASCHIDHAPAIEVKALGVRIVDDVAGILLLPRGEVSGDAVPVAQIRVDQPVDELADLAFDLLRRVRHDLALKLLCSTASQL